MNPILMTLSKGYYEYKAQVFFRSLDRLVSPSVLLENF